MKERFFMAISNEDGAGVLEAVVLISVMLVITSGLWYCHDAFLELIRVRANNSNNVGWHTYG